MAFTFNDKHLIYIRDNPHVIGHMCGKDKLNGMHSEWIKYLWTSVVNRGLQGHRGSYKTTAITVVGCIWWLLWHRNDRIAIIRKSFTDASDTLKTISLIMKMPEMQALFQYAHGYIPHAIIDRDNKLTFNFKDTRTPEGNVDAYGLDSGITGRHYDKIILDDIITLKDRISRAEREKTKEMVYEICANIIDPGKQVMHTGTPWHKNDAWSLINTIQEPIKYNIHRTGLLTTEDIENKKLKMPKLLFSINYELEHVVDTDQMFSDPNFSQWQYSMTGVKGQLDAKYSGKDTNALTFMYRKDDGRIQAVGFMFPDNVKDKYNFIKEKYVKYYCTELWNETNADKGFLADNLKTMNMKVNTYHEDWNKFIKISTILTSEWNNIDWSPETDDEYLEQILSYREGETVDDCPDSAASLLLRGGFVKGNKNDIINLYS